MRLTEKVSPTRAKEKGRRENLPVSGEFFEFSLFPSPFALDTWSSSSAC
jgi:hypothetical protein